MIFCKNVRFSYPAAFSRLAGFTLECPDFQALAGTITIIVGGNGTGKTTFLKLLAGILEQDRGSIVINTKTQKRKNVISWLDVRASESLVDSLLVADHLALGELGGGNSLPFIPRLSSHSSLTGDVGFLGEIIDQLRWKQISDLSFGQRQLVAVGLSVASGRPVLLADESTANLDFGNKHSLFLLLRRLAIEKRMAIVAVTHDLDLAAEFGSSIYYLRDGFIQKALDGESRDQRHASLRALFAT